MSDYWIIACKLNRAFACAGLMEQILKAWGRPWKSCSPGVSYSLTLPWLCCKGHTCAISSKSCQWNEFAGAKAEGIGKRDMGTGSFNSLNRQDLMEKLLILICHLVSYWYLIKKLDCDFIMLLISDIILKIFHFLFKRYYFTDGKKKKKGNNKQTKS